MNTREIASCEQALQILAEHLDHELDEHLDTQLHRHLESCRSCYSRAEFEKRLKAQIRELGTDEVPTDVAARIQTLLTTFTTA